jgi:hypothetical protein
MLCADNKKTSIDNDWQMKESAEESRYEAGYMDFISNMAV